MARVEKVLLIGLDSAVPRLVFESWGDVLPNLQRLMSTGMWGHLESCVPPEPTLAWACMATGKDPGTLGVYGATDRRDWSYEEQAQVTSLDIRHPRLWDHVGRAGHDSILIGVPPTFPVLRPVRGCQVTCQLTPGTESPFVHPAELEAEIAGVVGAYQLDIAGYRTRDKAWLVEQAERLSAQRFAVARHLLATRAWSLAWLVDLGPDRLQRGLGAALDTGQDGGEPKEDALRSFYARLDARVGELLTGIDRERTAVWVVSASGMQRLEGTLCLNDWLIRAGLLVLKAAPAAPELFNLAMVDWARTRAWSVGGNSGRIYLNVADREPRGVVTGVEYDAMCAELIERLEALEGPDGAPLGNRVLQPHAWYDRVEGIAPDLIVLAGGQRWRVAETAGHEADWVRAADSGPEEAVSDRLGLHILGYPGGPVERNDASVYDVLPTVLQLLGIPAPRGLRGSGLIAR